MEGFNIMKTIKTLVENNSEWGKLKLGTILRVNDEAAIRFVNANEAMYVSKSEWKKQENKTPT